MTEIRSLKYKIVPGLVVLLTISLPFLHNTISRKYNYQIALVELLIIFVAILVYNRDFFLSLPGESFEFKLIIAFLVSALISTLLAPKISIATLRYISIVIWLTYLWLMVFLIREKYLSSRTLIIAGAISCLLPIGVILISYGISDTDQNLMATFERLNYYSNIRHFGYHLTAATMLSLYFLLNNQFSPKKLAVGLALITINIITLIWSGSRQGILVTILFSLILLVLYYRNSWKRVLFGFASFVLLLTTVVYFSGGELVIKQMYQKTILNSDLNLISSGRILIWIKSLELLDGNWWFGFGPDSFIFIKKQLGIKGLVQPHSIGIQSLLEWGVIGSTIYFFIIGRVLLKTGRLIKTSDPVAITTYIFVCAYIANALVDGIYYHVLPIYFSSVGFAILISQQNKKALPPTG